MAYFNFITVRLGKDSLPDIEKICLSEVGILKNPFKINVKCTQIPDNYNSGDYAFIWLGSDNNKGMPTKWKQGFKAVGRVGSILRGESYNDTSETGIDILYVFKESINRLDILRSAPVAYYWGSSLPLIGIDDHANQTIRSMSGSSFSDIRSFFVMLESVSSSFRNDIVQIEPGFASLFDWELPNPKEHPLTKNLNELNLQKHKKLTLQQIFYGAPGTGKSNTIKREVDDQHKKNFRVTFHPDSDYSTFVGAYKPTKVKTHKQPRMNMSLDDLAKELGHYYNNEELGKIGGLQRFCFEYYPYIDGEYMSVNVTKLIELAGVPKDYNVEINKYIKFIHLFPNLDPDKITYEFVPQAFTKAYTAAWNTTEDVYLIIEEINRGNCAQIFGDLFQLLDRKDGISEYPVDADADLANYISKKLENSSRTDFPDGVKEGKKLVLPKNLYILATMNTSDQSLFPIDSAFKRRWDWTYMKIKNHPEENYKIKLSDKEYDWWEFIQRINEIIASMTSSADKQLGYFFCKAASDGTISPETFVSKVIFYLWNDVFKDYGFEDASLFRYKNDREEMKDLTFPDFYDEAGEKVNETRLKDFLDKVLNWKKDKEEQNN